MSLTYTSSNQIELSCIPDKLAVPRPLKAVQSQSHSALVTYVVNHYKNTNKYRQQVCDALNIITYCLISRETPPYDWTVSDPLNTIPEYDMELVKTTCSVLFLTPEAIIWDVTPVSDPIVEVDVAEPVVAKSNIQKQPVAQPQSKVNINQELTKQNLSKLDSNMNDKMWVDNAPLSSSRVPTKKEDLWLAPPLVPTFDRNKVWLAKEYDGEMNVVYVGLPEIPRIQRQINVTTDPTKMTDTEFMNLYPDKFIRTRKPELYERVDGLDYDEDLGCILPIQGFTKEQVLDNMIKYPHFYRLRRIVDPEAHANNPTSYADGIAGFYQDIEIEGELLSTITVWDSLPESKVIPRNAEFVKEYVIRRYLLERDAGIKHKYPLHGVLEPYITLFMPPEMYAKRGYVDTLGIVKQCVRARIMFFRSLNPFLKRIGVDYNDIPLPKF